MRRAVIAFSVSLFPAGCAEPSAPVPHAWTPTAAAERGERIAERACSGCHAIGASGGSPIMGAPPFRALQLRFNEISLARRMTELAPHEHREMAPLQLDSGEIGDLVAYIQAIEAP